MNIPCNTGYGFIALFIVLLLGISPAVRANQPAESADTLTGRLGTGVMFINSGNNLNPSGSEKLLTDLTSGADMKMTLIPFVAPALSYDIGAPDGFKLFFNTRPAIDEVGSFSINLGGTYPTGLGIVEVSGLFVPFEKVWENPYQLNRSRAQSATSKYGVKLALNRLMGSDFHVNVVIMHNDVDDDEIGRIEPDLRRDGQVYAVSINYQKTFSQSLSLRPEFSVRMGEYQGASNSFTKLKASLAGRYTYHKLTVLPQIAYAYKKNDKVHPIFNETKEENSLELRLLMSYATPFGWDDWAAQMLLSYSSGDVNLDFYDTEAITTGLFMVYNF